MNLRAYGLASLTLTCVLEGNRVSLDKSIYDGRILTRAPPTAVAHSQRRTSIRTSASSEKLVARVVLEALLKSGALHVFVDKRLIAFVLCKRLVDCRTILMEIVQCPLDL